ncbi:MAG TPA: hypothetical protein VMD29_07460 [Terracidiphilus sp.]|nr:hypothetical protein [Terracidiphilus sp.]
MSLKRVPVCLVLLLSGVPGLAAPPDTHVAAVPAGNDTVSIHLQWDGATPLPAGALIACRARVVPLAPQGGSAAVQPAEASVQAPGSAGQCALEIPLMWRGGASPASVTLIYQMDVASAAGRVARTGSQTISVAAGSGTGPQLSIRM